MNTQPHTSSPSRPSALATLARTLTGPRLALLGLIALAGAASPTLGQSYNRIVDSNDITIAQNPDGTWQISARALFANQDPAPVDLSSTLTVGVNGVVIGTISQALIVGGGSGTGGVCASSCFSEAGCVSCKPSVIPGLPCYCCTHAIDASALTVPSLKPGDVITATVTALPGSAPEAITSDDWGFKVVPPHVRYNRIMDASSLRYEPAPTGGYMITGEIKHELTYGDTINLSADIAILSGGVVIGGGHGGGSCGSTDLVTYGPGHPWGPAGPGGPMLYTCLVFCQTCTGYDVNLCNPPASAPTPIPWCECQQFCLSRIVPGPRWVVEVPELDPSSSITVRLSELPGAAPEIDTSDDAVTVRIADITPGQCLGDYNQDGGIDGADVQSFFGDWEAGNAAADVNADGGVDGADVSTFFEHWENGC